MKEDLLEMNYQILDNYGIEDQIIIWIEEMSELTKELCKWKRNFQKGELKLFDLCNMEFETTDVQVCIDQLKKAINYTMEHQAENYEAKVKRQLKRIEEEKESE